MFFHAGGLVLGDFDIHQHVVHDLCVASNCAVVFVDYSGSPEVKYPTAIIECYLTTKWVAQNGAEIGVAPARLQLPATVPEVTWRLLCMMAKKKREPFI